MFICEDLILGVGFDVGLVDVVIFDCCVFFLFFFGKENVLQLDFFYVILVYNSFFYVLLCVCMFSVKSV